LTYGAAGAFLSSMDTSSSTLSLPTLCACAGLLMSGASTATAATNCDINDIASLKHCVAGQFDQLTMRRDLTCTSAAECCGPNTGALIRMHGVAGRTFDGEGHTLHRGPGGRICSAIAINQSSDILIKDLALDEGAGVSPCEISDKNCPYTVAVDGSRNVHFDGVHISFGKGFVMHVWDTDGFALTRSSLTDSGIIGLAVGHYKYGPSKNVTVTDDIFERTRTSAVAVSGVDNMFISHNAFIGNHWHGLWPSTSGSGGIVGGGQIRVADATDLRIIGNRIHGIRCGNCIPPNQPATGVELGDEDHSAPGVLNIVIDDNDFDVGIAIYQNVGSNVISAQIENNRLHGHMRLDTVASPAVRSGNVNVP
jgi:hypothetical protein